MRRFLMIAPFLPLMAAPLMAETPPFDEAAVRAACEADWPDSFMMQKNCIDQNRAGHTEFLRIAALADTDPAFDPATLTACLSDWLPSWFMAANCADQNQRALAEMASILADLPEAPRATIERGCNTDWPTSHFMQAFCVRQQTEAWRALQD